MAGGSSLEGDGPDISQPDAVMLDDASISGEEFIDLFEVVQRITEASRASSPNSAENYIRISDKALSEHLPAEMVGTSSVYESQVENSLGKIERALAEVPAFTTERIKFNGSCFRVETCPATIELACEGFIENYGDYVQLAVRAGVSLEEAYGIGSLFKSGKGILIKTQETDNLICNNDSYLRFHEVASTTRFDKVDTRELAKGYFPQPAYLDGRYVRNLSGYHFEVFSPNEVYEAIPPEFFDERYRVAVLSTNAFNLFRFGEKFFCEPLQSALYSNKDARLIFPDRPSNELSLMRSILGSEVVPSSIKELFEKFESNKVRFVNEMRENIKEQERPSVSKLLLSLQEPVYIKGSLSSGGRMVVKLSFDESGAPVLESSSPDFALLFENMLYTVEERIQSAKGRDILEEEKSYTERYGVCVERVLREVLSRIEQPIIEAEIPFETRKGNRVEFRIICQKVSSEKEPSVVAHYCKESSDPVAANISIAGVGSPTEDVIRDLVANRHGDLTDAEQVDKTKQYLAEMISAVNKFIPIYSGRRKIQDFAVDLVPVWNEEKNALEFWLLEVQTPYGFSGLESIDPTLAQEVRERIARNRKEEEN